MTVSFQMKDGVGVMMVTGVLTASSGWIASFQEQCLGWLESKSDVRYIVMNLTNVEFLDSSGLGALLALLKCVAERNGDMKIACLKQKARTIFQVTRMNKVFDIFENEDEAIQSCEAKKIGA